MNRFVLAIALLVHTIGSASASQSGCPQHHLDGIVPHVVNEALLQGAKELCYAEFSIVHSGLTRTPLWAGELLTSSRLDAARNIEREDVFAAEPALSENERSELSDYARSGFDRGHVAPAADMSTPESKAESFTLANIVPQTASSNRGEWSDVERLARDIAMDRGAAYIVTGPLFLAEQLSAIGRGVAVPTHMFKAVYVPSTGEIGAYLVSNDEAPVIEMVSIERLTTLAGVDVFPSLPSEMKSPAPNLPRP